MKQFVKQPRTNPFATRFVAPGQLEWCESELGELDRLAGRFTELGCRAQIVGPHGSGKTTLLHHLAPRLGAQAKGKADPSGVVVNPKDRVVWLTLRRGTTKQRFLNQQLRALSVQDLLIMDGFEQLNWWQQQWVRCVTKIKRCGLLVTCHRPVSLPILKETRIATELAKEIVRQTYLEATGSHALPEPIAQVDYAKLLIKHEGSMRECLMELYDIVEANSLTRSSGSLENEQGDKR